MSFVDGKCPLCGSEIRVPENQTQCYCPSCGQQVLASAAIAFASDATVAQSQSSTADSIGSTNMTTNEPSSNPGNEGGSISAAPKVGVAEKSEFLERWKRTPMGFAVLGCLFPLPALITLGLGYFLYTVLVVNVSFVAAIVAFLACYLALFIISAFYALKVYPTLITETPKLKSPGLAAYLNLAFGGIIFGSIWCSSITKRRKSSSQYVFVVLLVIAFIAYVVMYSGQILGASSNTVVSDANAQSYKVVGYIEPDDSQWSSASGTLSMSSSSISFDVSAKSKQLSEKGSYVGEEEGWAVYQTNYGKYVAYSEVEGMKMIMVVSNEQALYYLQIE